VPAGRREVGVDRECHLEVYRLQQRLGGSWMRCVVVPGAPGAALVMPRCSRRMRRLQRRLLAVAEEAKGRVGRKRNEFCAHETHKVELINSFVTEIASIVILK